MADNPTPAEPARILPPAVIIQITMDQMSGNNATATFSANCALSPLQYLLAFMGGANWALQQMAGALMRPPNGRP